MTLSYRHWRHLFKLDPEKTISEDDLNRLLLSDTDGFIVGGSTGVTYDAVWRLCQRIKTENKLCLCEVSDLHAIVSNCDGYLIPVVLNAQNVKWIFEPHLSAIKQFVDAIPWEKLLVEGYLVMNPDSAVGQLVDAKYPISLGEGVAYAQLVEKLLKFPLFYLEYSGKMGDLTFIQTLKAQLKHTHLVYGGGISSLTDALAILPLVDTIVVGNIIYESIDAALETVGAMKQI
jgi:putative glycerol-1-phosphate prenyltransferase